MSDDALIRRTNLKSLGYTPSYLVSRIGKSYQYWRDLMYTEKSFGEKTARNIEENLDLVRGSLDRIEGAQSLKGNSDVPVAPAADTLGNLPIDVATLQMMLGQIEDPMRRAKAYALAMLQISRVYHGIEDQPTHTPEPPILPAKGTAPPHKRQPS